MNILPGTLLEIINNNSWIKTSREIFKFDGKSLYTFKGRNAEIVCSTEIGDIWIDNNQNIWIAKTFEGVFKLETKLN